MKIETLAPYHLPHEEILLSIASSVIFKELELQDCPKLSLSEVIEQPQYGYTASASHEPVGVKFVRITDIQAGKIDWNSVPYCECEYPEKYLLREKDILFARTGGTTGKSFIVKGDIPDSIFASYLIRIRPKDGTISDFLYWFFQTNQYWSQIVTEKEGSAQPNVNGKKLSSLDIFVPARSIQEAIANYLNSYKSKVYGDLLELPSLPAILKDAEKKVRSIESLMTRIGEARRLRAEAEEEAESLVVSARQNLIYLKKANKLKNLMFDKTIEKLRGPKPGLPQKEYKSSGKFPVVDQGKDYIGGYTDDESRVFKVTEPVIVWGDHTTNSKLIDFDFVPGADGTKIFSPKEGLIAGYVNQFLKTVVYPDLGYSRYYRYLKNQQIPLLPLPEQHRIVAYLDSLQVKVDELKRLQIETEKELEELVPSILDKAFKGEL